jgi:hypothetical protein
MAPGARPAWSQPRGNGRASNNPHAYLSARTLTWMTADICLNQHGLIDRRICTFAGTGKQNLGLTLEGSPCKQNRPKDSPSRFHRRGAVRAAFEEGRRLTLTDRIAPWSYIGIATSRLFCCLGKHGRKCVWREAP